MTCRRQLWLCAATLVSTLWIVGPASGEAPNVHGCTVPVALSAIKASLPFFAHRIEQGGPVKIVAFGSSSTSGVGASAPAMNYPSRLEEELKARFPGIPITVVNRGIGGQDAPEQVARIDAAVLAEQPDLVIWQVGTNAVLRRDDLAADRELIERAVDLISHRKIDVVLMDLQYAPRVLARPGWRQMEEVIAGVAERAGIGLFRRFAIMQEWARTHQLAPAVAIGPDGLHMTDASYGCLASELAQALAANLGAQNKLVNTIRENPDAIAGLGRARTSPHAEGAPEF